MVADVELFPTQVGVIPELHNGWIKEMTFPHASGGDPLPETDASFQTAFSPRKWG